MSALSYWQPPPVFTRKSVEAAANQAALLQQLVTEFQSVASGNDAHVKALEKGTLLAEKSYQHAMVPGNTLFIICAIFLCTVLCTLLP